VRFADGRAVQDALYRIVETGLGAAFTRQVGLGFVPAPSHSRSVGVNDASANAALFSGSGSLTDAAIASLGSDVAYPTRELDAAPLSTEPGAVLPEVEFIAQVRGMFLLCQSEVHHPRSARRCRAPHLRTANVPRTTWQCRPCGTRSAHDASGRAPWRSPRHLSPGMDVRPAGVSKIAVYGAAPGCTRRSGHCARLLGSSVALVAVTTPPRSIGKATMACHGSIRKATV
jgi:hypothetical protein